MTARHAAVLALASLLACESTSGPGEVVLERTVTPEMVTGAALAVLQPDGRFALPLPTTTASQLSLEEAKAQALQFALYVTNNVLLRSGVEGGRGGYWVDPHLMTICGASSYLHSQLGDISHDSLGQPGISFLKRFGGQWLIPFCGPANEPQMTVMAAIDGNDIRFVNGQPNQPFPLRNFAWAAEGVPLNWPDPLTLSAERAVRFAFETFGVRVSEVPRLYKRANFRPDGRYDSFQQSGGGRSCHRWRLTLESSVRVTGMTSFATSTTNILWVGTGSCDGWDVLPLIHLPSATQPTATTLSYVDTLVSPPRTWSVTVPFSAPVVFEIGMRAR